MTTPTYMSRFGSIIRKRHEDESGATATEYLVLLILVACFVIAVVKQFGSTVSKKIDTANDAVRKELVF